MASPDRDHKRERDFLDRERVDHYLRRCCRNSIHNHESDHDEPRRYRRSFDEDLGSGKVGSSCGVARGCAEAQSFAIYEVF